ncbi:MAG: hypothetical protein EBS74_08775 [Flavobacteriia bacterium]|nr:hypothetical protein [Flavobacteriia bacterium]
MDVEPIAIKGISTGDLAIINRHCPFTSDIRYLGHIPLSVQRTFVIGKSCAKEFLLREIREPDQTFETNKVLIQAEVSRFTEKSLEAFVKIKNLPDSLAIKLFPQSLQVTFLVRVSKADQLKAVDFDFFCDYDQMRYEEGNSIEVFLANEPEGVRNIRWTPKRVDYLIRK